MRLSPETARELRRYALVTSRQSARCVVLSRPNTDLGQGGQVPPSHLASAADLPAVTVLGATAQGDGMGTWQRVAALDGVMWCSSPYSRRCRSLGRPSSAVGAVRRSPRLPERTSPRTHSSTT